MSELSLLGKRWIILNNDKQSTILERLLVNRGIVSEEDTQAFLNPDFNKLHDPYLMADMDKAVKRVQRAIKNGERIIIFGDYDVDGVTGTAIMVLILQKLGANVSYRLPNRMGDGYGLNANVIEECKEVDTGLLITVDCGISCIDEISLANEYGIDIIITDHHTIPATTPNAYAILHPKLSNSGYPYTELTGAGVALKFASALIKEMIPKSEQQELIRKYSDLATLGTVADLGPLTGENRIIVKEGLKQMQQSAWEGLTHLLEVCGIDKDEYIHTNHVGFRLAPRINAAGRLESAYFALKLFLCEGEKSKLFAEKLEKINKERQRLTEMISKEAEEIVQKQLKREKILIAYHPSWHSGLVGIIAGKLAGKYGMPVIIMEERNDTYIGSARGPEYFNMVEALQNCSKYLESFGGHVQAAGFTLHKDCKDLFVHSMQVYAREFLANSNTEPVLQIDTELAYNDINLNLIEQVDTIRPYGMKNERPTFLIKGVSMHSMRQVGHDKSHLLGKLRLDTTDYKFIAFSVCDKIPHIPEYTRADIVCHIDKNIYNGNTNLEIQVIDLMLT